MRQAVNQIVQTIDLFFLLVQIVQKLFAMTIQKLQLLRRVALGKKAIDPFTGTARVDQILPQ